MNKLYYAIKFKKGGYWTRNTSPTPSLFTTEEKARATMRQHTAYKDDDYTIVTFTEVE